MKKKSILLCLAAALLLGLTIRPGLLASATSMSSITSDSIKEKQEQIEQAEKEKETLQSNLSDLKEIKENLETEKTNLTNYVAELDRNLSDIEDNITELRQQISAKEEEITHTQAELDAALADFPDLRISVVTDRQVLAGEESGTGQTLALLEEYGARMLVPEEEAPLPLDGAVPILSSPGAADASWVVLAS